jgi:hypothetical protein
MSSNAVCMLKLKMCAREECASHLSATLQQVGRNTVGAQAFANLPDNLASGMKYALLNRRIP